MSAKEVIKPGAKAFEMIQSQVSNCMWCNYTKFLMLSLCESVLILHDWYLYVLDVVTERERANST